MIWPVKFVLTQWFDNVCLVALTGYERLSDREASRLPLVTIAISLVGLWTASRSVRQFG